LQRPQQIKRIQVNNGLTVIAKISSNIVVGEWNVGKQPTSYNLRNFGISREKTL